MADITIPLQEEKNSIHKKMTKAVAKAKGKLEGNEDNGNFEIPVAVGTIKGEYTINEDALEVKVTKKPMLVSNKMIQEALEKFLTSS